MPHGSNDFLRLPGVKAKTGLSKSEIKRLERLGRFPKSILISPRVSVFVLGEVQAWIDARIAERGDKKPKRVAVKKGDAEQQAA